jgi:hypothetical protein
MHAEDYDDLLRSVIDEFGVTHQAIKAIEEMAELTVELAKGINLIKSNGNLLEEVADVQIVLDQLKIAFFKDQEEFESIKDKKLEKLQRHLEAAKSK